MGSGASKATSSFSEQEVRARRRKERQSTHNVPLSHVQASPVVAELAAGRVCRHGDGRHPVSSNGYVYHPHGIYIERPCGLCLTSNCRAWRIALKQRLYIIVYT